MKVERNWSRYAQALDWHLEGIAYVEIGRRFGVTRERARQMVFDAKRQLAYRVFKGVERPRPQPHDGARYSGHTCMVIPAPPGYWDEDNAEV